VSYKGRRIFKTSDNYQTPVTVKVEQNKSLTLRIFDTICQSIISDKKSNMILDQAKSSKWNESAIAANINNFRSIYDEKIYCFKNLDELNVKGDLEK
jgi:hypothetical protein